MDAAASWLQGSLSEAHPPGRGWEEGSHVFASQHTPAEVARGQHVTALPGHLLWRTNLSTGCLAARSSRFLFQNQHCFLTLTFNAGDSL